MFDRRFIVYDCTLTSERLMQVSMCLTVLGARRSRDTTHTAPHLHGDPGDCLPLHRYYKNPAGKKKKKLPVGTRRWEGEERMKQKRMKGKGSEIRTLARRGWVKKKPNK